MKGESGAIGTHNTTKRSSQEANSEISISIGRNPSEHLRGWKLGSATWVKESLCTDQDQESGRPSFERQALMKKLWQCFGCGGPAKSLAWCWKLPAERNEYDGSFNLFPQGVPICGLTKICQKEALEEVKYPDSISHEGSVYFANCKITSSSAPFGH